MYLKRDPGPCPVDDAPHTTCCAPTAGPIVAGPITPTTSITVPSPTTPPFTSAQREQVEPTVPEMTPPPAPETFTTSSYRGKRSRDPRQA